MPPPSRSPKELPTSRRLAALALALLLIAGCDDASEPRPEPTTSPTAAPIPGGTLTFGVLGEPATLDPYSPKATQLTWTLARPVYPSLFRELPDGSIEPDLAASITKIRGGIRVELARRRWSDGRPVTARDVTATVARASADSGFARIDEASVAGRRSVLLTGDLSDWERTLAHRALVLPGGEAEPKSAGPFEITSTTPGLEIVYRPNPMWTGEPPYLDRLIVRFIESVPIMLELLERDRLDAASVPSTLNVDAELRSVGVDFDSALGSESVWLDLGEAGLTSGERGWLWRNVDRKLIEEGFVRSAGKLATRREPHVGPPARPSSLTIIAPAGDALLELIQVALYEQLNAAGVDVETVDLPPRDLARVDLPGARIVRSFDPASREAVGDASIQPLFEVATFIAFAPGAHNILPVPTVDGPLAHASEWWIEH